MSDVFRRFVRLLWPPHHTASAEQLHTWRIGMSASVIGLAVITGVHIVMAAGAADPYYPGFVTRDEYDDQNQRWARARIQDLRVDILRLHVDYCLADGALASSYNQQLNELLADYRAWHGPDVLLPDCADVRRGRNGRP